MPTKAHEKIVERLVEREGCIKSSFVCFMKLACIHGMLKNDTSELAKDFESLRQAESSGCAQSVRSFLLKKRIGQVKKKDKEMAYIDDLGFRHGVDVGYDKFEDRRDPDDENTIDAFLSAISKECGFIPDAFNYNQDTNTLSIFEVIDTCPVDFGKLGKAGFVEDLMCYKGAGSVQVEVHEISSTNGSITTHYPRVVFELLYDHARWMPQDWGKMNNRQIMTEFYNFAGDMVETKIFGEAGA
jgi:hypothetical protein